MDTLFEKLGDLQSRYSARIHAYASCAADTFDRFTTPFSSPEKEWSIPWLNDFGQYVAKNSRDYPSEDLAQYLGEGLVRYHGGVWCVLDEDGRDFGVFDRHGLIGHSVRSAAERVKLGKPAGNFGFEWLHTFLGDLSGPSVEGTDLTVGHYRDLLYNFALQEAFQQPGLSMDAAITLATEHIEPKTGTSLELYQRVKGMGMAPIGDAVNQVLIENGRAPLA